MTSSSRLLFLRFKSFQNKARRRAWLCQQKLAKMSKTDVHPGYLQLEQLTPPCASAGSSSLCAAATLDHHKNKPPLQSSTVPPLPSPPPLTKKKKKKKFIHQHLHTITAPFRAEWRRRRWSPLCLLTLLLPARLFPLLFPLLSLLYAATAALLLLPQPNPSPPHPFGDCSPFSCDRRGLGAKRDAQAHPSYAAARDAKRPSLGARLELMSRAFRGGGWVAAAD